VFAAKRIPSLSAIRAAAAAGRAAPARVAPPVRTEAARPGAARGRRCRAGRRFPGGPRRLPRTLGAKEEGRRAAPAADRPAEARPASGPEKISLSEAVTVKELAEKLNRKSKDIIAKLMTRGVLANINQPLEPAVAIEVAREFGSEASIVSFEEEVQHAPSTQGEKEAATEAPEKLVPRPPVVTVMGTWTTGRPRSSTRSGSPTSSAPSTGHHQHIGAYQVTERERKITFLDTPGHEAFTMMRARAHG